MRASGESKGERSLDELERWFQAAVVRPQERGRRARADRAPAEEEILPSAHLAPAERIDIYGSMYFLRMRDALAVDYPALQRLAGAEGFEHLVRAYVTAHPSRRYSLNFLGEQLPAFLSGPVRIPRRALLADVARLERAMSEAFDAERSPVLSPAELAAVPPEAWTRARIRLGAAVRVLALEHRANAIVAAVRKDEPLPPLGRSRTWTVVYRKDQVVWRTNLTESMHAVLRVLAANGTLPEAIGAAARAFRGSPEALQAEIFRWFGEWASEGLFAAVDLDEA